MPAPWSVSAYQGAQRVGFCTDFSLWTEVVSVKLDRWVVTLETRTYTQSSFMDPCSQTLEPPQTEGAGHRSSHW